MQAFPLGPDFTSCFYSTDVDSVALRLSTGSAGDFKVVPARTSRDRSMKVSLGVHCTARNIPRSAPGLLGFEVSNAGGIALRSRGEVMSFNISLVERHPLATNSVAPVTCSSCPRPGTVVGFKVRGRHPSQFDLQRNVGRSPEVARQCVVMNCPTQRCRRRGMPSAQSAS